MKKNIKTKSKILLVDDEKTILEMYSIRLNQEGFKVFTADSAQNGMEIINKEKPDLVFADIVMPKKDGFWLLGKIKKHKDEKISETPVIMLTNMDDPDSRKKCCNLGCLYFLVKPRYSPSKLVEMIEDILTVKKHSSGILANK
ncbi:MAG: response regulator [Candidatus Falkowbacteria bacterium]